MKNKVILGKDNKVEFVFTFEGEFQTDGLNNFDEITLSLGGELYSTVSNPTLLYKLDSTTLVLNIGDITALGVGYTIPTITGFIESRNEELELNSPAKNRLGGYVLISETGGCYG